MKIKITFFLSLLFYSAFGQDEFLEEQIKQILHDQINELRAAENLHPLQNDEILDAAAFDQATYIKSLNKVVHEQDKSKKKTLKDRIKYYAGLHAQYGENGAIIVLGSKEKIKKGGERVLIDSHEKAIQAVLNSWMDEDEGRKNLLDQGFYTLGTSVVMGEDQQLNIIAVFGSLPYLYPNNAEFSKGLYGTEEYDKVVCDKFIEKHPSISQLFSDAFVIENNELFFRYHDIPFVQSLLEGGSDGIAAEIILKEQLACGEGNRLYPGTVNDGYLLRPIRKNNLYGNNLMEDKKEVKISLGTLPDFYDQKTSEINGVIIKEGHHCATVPYNKIATSNVRWFEQDYLLAGDSLENGYKWSDTIAFQLQLDEEKAWENALSEKKAYFDRINFELDYLDIKLSLSPGHQSMSKQNIKSVVYQKLGLDSNSFVGFNSWVDWGSYQKFQIGTFYQLDTEGMDSAQVSTYLEGKQAEDKELLEFLSGLNRIRIKAYGTGIVQADVPLADKQSIIPQMMNENRMEPALFLQKSMIRDMQSDKVQYDQIPLTDPSQKKYTLPYISNLIVANEMEGNASFDANPTHLAFFELFLINKNQTEVAFNRFISELKFWSVNTSRVKNMEDWKAGFTKIRPKINRTAFARGMLNYSLIAADYYYEKQKFNERRKAFEEILRWQKLAALTSTEVLQLAQYLCYQDQLGKAVELLYAHMKKEEIDKELLLYFLQIGQYENDIVSEKFYLERLQHAKENFPDDFCKLFSKEKMGIQSLKNPNIKNVYCSSCN
ncbi:MAG: hypothetical protein CMO34_03735 [Verrucomicrobia bacterium]|nr:hypothetical protein [Verrucomicrobiota bacterium]